MTKMTTMTADQLDLARAQLKGLGRLMHHLYVKKEESSVPTYTASYVVRGEAGQIIFYKQAHLFFKTHIAGGHLLGMYPSALEALHQHFTPEYIATDAMEQLYTLGMEHGRYNPGSMEYDPVFGQEVYSADLEELHLPNDGYISLH